MLGFEMLVRVQCRATAGANSQACASARDRARELLASRTSAPETAPTPEAEMEARSKPQFLMILTLLSVLFSQTLAWPLFGPPSALSRTDDRGPFEEANDRGQVSLKADSDFLQNALAENDTPYYGVSRNARHVDAIFTHEFSKLLGQLSARKYIDSVIGKRVSSDSSEQPALVKRHSDAIFTDNYTRLRKQMAMKKYLNSILNGKRSNVRETHDFPDDFPSSLEQN